MERINLQINIRDDNMQLSISGNLVDVHAREIYPAKVAVEAGRIVSIEKIDSIDDKAKFIMPRFIDSHIHIESSMLRACRFLMDSQRQK